MYHKTTDPQQPRPGVPGPPDIVIKLWQQEWLQGSINGLSLEELIARRAAAWGANEQLRLCVEWLKTNGYRAVDAGRLHAAMRPPEPKPPSLAEKAYVAFVQICKGSSDDADTYDDDEALVRQALKRLAELEAMSDD